MREQELQQLWEKIQERLRQSGKGQDRAQRETLMREYLPQLLKARYASEEVRLSEEAKQAGLAQLLAAVRDKPARSSEIQRAPAHLLGPPLEEPPAPFPDGRHPRWKRLVIPRSNWRSLGVAAVVILLILAGFLWPRGQEADRSHSPQIITGVSPQHAPPTPQPPVPKGSEKEKADKMKESGERNPEEQNPGDWKGSPMRLANKGSEERNPEEQNPGTRVRPAESPLRGEQAERVAVSLTDLVYDSDLIVTGQIEKVVTDDTDANQTWGTLAVDEPLKGPPDVTTVLLGFPARSRESEGLAIYYQGDEGVWLLQRAKEGNFYRADYPERRLSREFVPMIRGLLQDVPVETALGWLREGSPKIRGKVLDLLLSLPCGKADRQRIVETLTHLLAQETDSDAYNRWMTALCAIDREQALPVLRKALRQDRGGEPAQQLGFRLRVCEQLAALGDRSIIPELTQLAQGEGLRGLTDVDSANGIHQEAVRILAQLGDRTFVPYFVERLKSEDQSEQKRALEALQWLEAEEAVPALIDFMAGKDRYLCQRAAAILNNLTFREFYVKVGEGSISSAPNEDPEVWRKWWAEHQGQSRLDWALEAIHIGEVRSPSDLMRRLGQWGNRKAVPVLMEQLTKSRDRFVRMNAARALGELGDAAALPALRRAWQDPDWDVRVQAVGAACRLGDQGGRPWLREAVRPPYPEGFRHPHHAISVLAEAEGQKAIPVLVQVLAACDQRTVGPVARELTRLTGQSFGGIGWRATDEGRHRVVAQWQRWLAREGPSESLPSQSRR